MIKIDLGLESPWQAVGAEIYSFGRIDLVKAGITTYDEATRDARIAVQPCRVCLVDYSTLYAGPEHFEMARLKAAVIAHAVNALSLEDVQKIRSKL